MREPARGGPAEGAGRVVRRREHLDLPERWLARRPRDDGRLLRADDVAPAVVWRPGTSGRRVEEAREQRLARSHRSAGGRKMSTISCVFRWIASSFAVSWSLGGWSSTACARLPFYTSKRARVGVVRLWFDRATAWEVRRLAGEACGGTSCWALSWKKAGSLELHQHVEMGVRTYVRVSPELNELVKLSRICDYFAGLEVLTVCFRCLIRLCFHFVGNFSTACREYPVTAEQSSLLVV